MSNNDTRVIVDEVELSPEDLAFQDCEKVLRAGIWLIRNGYGRMAILPYTAPSGCYWRCEFHPVGQPQKSFFRYSSGSAGKFLRDHHGGRVRRSISPKGLARAIMRSVPDDMKAICAGDISPETESWLVLLERAISRRWIPSALHDYKDDLTRWDLFSLHGAPNSWMEPPLGYVVPGTEVADKVRTAP